MNSAGKPFALRHLRLWLMMVLTAVTGVLDAVGYLGLDRVFTGNMTGNVIVLGVGLASDEGLPVAGPLIALLGFSAGAAIVGRLVAGRPRHWHGFVSGAVTVNAVVLAAVATVLLIVPPTGDQSTGSVAAAASLAVAMGAQASLARFLAVPDMTTVVVTSTLTSLAGETLFAGGLSWLRHRRLWAVVVIFAGALTGALLLELHLCVPVYLAAAATALTALLGHRYWDRAQPDTATAS
jgi:uncharacterized membrane protein YoaK (UPF0700 family)